MYIYVGLPITPSIIAELTLQLFAGKSAKRETIVRHVLEYHISQGGARPEAQDFSRSVRKALTTLQSRQLATNRSYGFWDIVDSTGAPAPVLPEITTDELPIADVPGEYQQFGSGPEAVYLYYFDTYRQFALDAGKQSWRCKIGRTGGDPLSRILSQAATALPEKPTVAFVILTDDSATLESAIHAILYIRGEQIEDSPGSEWFFTNPDEVLKIIRFIDGGILDAGRTSHNST